jgi:hypothetical protein
MKIRETISFVFREIFMFISRNVSKLRIAKCTKFHEMFATKFRFLVNGKKLRPIIVKKRKTMLRAGAGKNRI